MFFHFLYPLHEIEGLGFLNVFRYLTFRSAYCRSEAVLIYQHSGIGNCLDRI